MSVMDVLSYHLSNMPLLGSAAYLFGVWSLHKIMSPPERKPVNIPKAMLLLYNVGQVLLNLYVALMISGPLGGRVWGIGQKDTPAVRYGVYLHMLCKVRQPQQLQRATAVGRHVSASAPEHRAREARQSPGDALGLTPALATQASPHRLGTGLAPCLALLPVPRSSRAPRASAASRR